MDSYNNILAGAVYRAGSTKQAKSYTVAKIKLKPIIKRHEGEVYTFINGVAEVPGMRMGNKNSWFGIRPVTVTLKEFLELTEV